MCVFAIMTHPSEMTEVEFEALLTQVDSATGAMLQSIRNSGVPMAAAVEAPGEPTAAPGEPTPAQDDEENKKKVKNEQGTARARSGSRNKMRLAYQVPDPPRPGAVPKAGPAAVADPGTAAVADPTGDAASAGLTIIIPDSYPDPDRDHALAEQWRLENGDITHDEQGKEIPMQAICDLPDAFLARLPAAPLDRALASPATQTITFPVQPKARRGKWDRVRTAAIFYIYGVKVLWSTREGKPPAYVGKGPVNRVYPALMTAQNCNVNDPTPKGEGWRGREGERAPSGLAYGSLDAAGRENRQETIATQRAESRMEREGREGGKGRSRGRSQGRGGCRGGKGGRGGRGAPHGGAAGEVNPRRGGSMSPRRGS